MGNVFIINVGVNASHGHLRSPIFDDGTFEFIPIPEKGRRHSCPECENLPRYCDLESFSGLDLLRYIPEGYHYCRVHNDPEFGSYTYGDYPTTSPRAANLQRLKNGDSIFFLARLVKWRKGVFSREAGFYFIGFLEVEDILKEVKTKPEQSTLRRYIHNTHVQRALYDPEFWDGFWVFKGSEGSCRFERAIPFSRHFSEQILRDARGHRLIWTKGRTELQVIGSHTRACRIIDGKNRLHRFWRIVSRYSHM